MNKLFGFITLAQQNQQTDYLRMAYALGLSLRATQLRAPNLTVLVSPGTVVPDEYRKAFDQVIEMPWHDDAESYVWKVQNKWKAIHLSPYDHTILVDADMLFTMDVSEWWYILGKRSFWASTAPFTYRGTPVERSGYREIFEQNKLPSIYTALTYFDKSQFAYEVFDAAKLVTRNWKQVRREYLPHRTPDVISGDLAFATAIKMLGAEHHATWEGLDFFGFTHMKTKAQGFEHEDAMYEDWTRHLRVTLKPDLSLMVGNYLQTKPFHYHVKSFLTDSIIQTLENARGRN